MKVFLINVMLFFAVLQLHSQTVLEPAGKVIIDTSDFGRWQSVWTPVGLSNNGQFAFYFVRNMPTGHSTLVVQSTYGNMKEEIPGASGPVFTEDSRKIIFIKSDGSLCVRALQSGFEEITPGVSNFILFNLHNEPYLLYLKNNEESGLVLKSMLTGDMRVFNHVESYILSEDCNSIVLKCKLDSGRSVVKYLNLEDFQKLSERIIWKGPNVSFICIDQQGRQIAFIVEDAGEKSLWYYNPSMEAAKLFLDNGSFETGLKIDNISRGFSKDGRLLFFEVVPTPMSADTNKSVLVDVWNHKDVKLQSLQLKELESNSIWDLNRNNYSHAIRIEDKHVLRFQFENDGSLTFGPNEKYVFVAHTEGDNHERHWNPKCKTDYFLISAFTGERRNIGIDADLKYGFSKDAKYIVSVMRERNGDVFSYDIETGKTRNLTTSIKGIKDRFHWDISLPKWFKIAGWTCDGERLLIYDVYDIWIVDPKGEHRPINLTNYFGRRHHIVFRLAVDNGDHDIPCKGKLILSAFDKMSKNNGFYYTELAGGRDPIPLKMDSNLYNSQISEFPALKARDTGVYLIRRESASHSRNYFITSDFKTLRPLSNVYPELKYNWLKTELHQWKTSEGRVNQGVLFKPENFNSKQKYPVIIHYYEKVSDRLNKYITPDVTRDFINIPWFVSRGYLVFTPDIYYTKGNPGQSAYTCIISAAKYLESFSWIDKKRIGIQGHSFGGFETNFIVTSSNIFAAAMSSSGFSNFISGYGSVTFEGGYSYFQMACEIGQNRIGATLWKRPDLYYKNSPIFRADKVTTPLLMMNNKEDGIVNFSQGIEFFTALRRLRRKAWMLQYDGESHVISSRATAMQHTIRVTQFFDHYLKGEPAPVWMTRGITAAKKGLETGLDLDPMGSCGDGCRICKNWNLRSKITYSPAQN